VNRLQGAFAWLCVSTAASAGQSFLTVNTLTDRLVRVDQGTGVVTDIGPLGVDTVSPDFERFGGDLYLLNAATGGAPLGFAVIDEASGSLPALTPFAMPGETVRTVEGITSDPAGLIVTVDVVSDAFTRSNIVARLDPSTGVLTEIARIPLGSTPDNGDIDGVAFDPVFGDLVGVDSSAPDQGTAFFRVDLSTGAVTPLFFESFAALGGGAISPLIEGDDLWVTTAGLPGEPARLVRFSRNGASWTRAGSVPIGVTGPCYTLARPGSCSAADIAPPLGVLDLADTDAFIAAFLSQDPLADLAPPAGIVDLADIDAFIAAFLGGCP